MAWTKQQQAAIDTRDKNILVSAAAGSGKTAILVERIKKLILEEGADVESFLIVTFTNAAAKEMKEKIRKALSKQRLAEADPKRKEHLNRQLIRLQSADISTFHAFAQKVIRRFFHIADVEPGFRVADDRLSSMLKEDAVENLLTEELTNGKTSFIDFLDSYSSDRNYFRFKNLITETHQQLMAMPYPWKWFDDSIASLSITEKDFPDSPAGKELILLTCKTIEDAYTNFKKAEYLALEKGFMDQANKIGLDAEKAKNILDIAKTGDLSAMRTALTNFRGETVRKPKDLNEKLAYEEFEDSINRLRKKAKDDLKGALNNFFSDSLSVQLEELRHTEDSAKELRRLIKRFDTIYAEKKRQKKVLDFNDLEHFALKILENPEAREHYREHFEYIFIDEYQDTNSVQEEIINRIKRDNNLFMVGDIKQSIYRFRLADPSIFREKYDAFEKFNGYDDGICKNQDDSVRIDLNKNFRSKETVLDCINNVFCNIMDGYDEDAALYTGFPAIKEKSDDLLAEIKDSCNHIDESDLALLPKPEFHIFDADMSDIDFDEAGIDTEIKLLHTLDIEALQVAQIIKNTVGKYWYDMKEKKWSKLRPCDITILLRSVSGSAESFINAFRSEGLEARIQEGSGYFNTLEIEMFINLLSVINNRQQDVPLISLLHSPVYLFTTEELAKIRLGKRRGSYFSALVNYMNSDDSDQALKEKCSRFFESIQKLRTDASLMPLPDFLWKTMLDTEYYVTMGAMPGGKGRQANLRALIDKADDFINETSGTLDSFIRYTDALKERKIPISEAPEAGNAENQVNIMTIHKSKGLEFPVVIVSGLAKKLRYGSGLYDVSIDKDIGIAMKIVNRKEHLYKYSILDRIIKAKQKREEEEEQLRVLYVAMTRAQDRLIMTGSVNNAESYSKKIQAGIVSCSSYMDMIIDTLRDEAPFSVKLEPEVLMVAHDDDAVSEVQEIPVPGETSRILSWKYPFEDQQLEKTKFSVTELVEKASSSGSEEDIVADNNDKTADASKKKEAFRFPISLEKPAFAKDLKLSAAEIGTAWHRVFEIIDFRKGGDIDYISSAVSDMEKQGVLSEQEAASIEISKISEFFHTEVGKRAVKAAENGLLSKEQNFTMKKTIAVNGNPEEGSREILVQGAIDCRFVEGGNIILVDYKTNRLRSKDWQKEKERFTSRYKKQLELYAEALHKATGKEVSEAYLYITEAGKAIRVF